MKIAVIGAGQGGLSAAIEARRRGHDVTVFESRERAGGKAAPIHRDGYRLDPGPSIVILPELYEETFRAAGRRMEDYLRFRPLPEITRVVMEGESPLDLRGNRADAIRLVESLDPQDAKNLAALLTKLDAGIDGVRNTIFRRPIDRWWRLLNLNLIKFGMAFDMRKDYRALIDGWFRHPLMRAFFYGFPSYGGQSYRSRAPGALTIPYFMLTDGVYWPVPGDKTGGGEGIAAIPAAFETLARKLGVTFRFGEAVTGLVREGDRIKGVRTEGGEEAFDAVIGAMDRFTLGERLLGRTETRQPSYSYFTFHWGLPRRIEGLKHHTLLIPRGFEAGFEHLYSDRAFPIPPIVYLNETTVTDPSMAPPGGGNLFAVITCPAQEPHLDWDRPDAQRAAVAATMAACGVPMPTDSVFERVQTPNLFAERDGSYRGSLYGVDERHRILGGAFPHSVTDPEIVNLRYCGGSVQPGAGLPMVTLSGRFAVESLLG